MNCELSAATKQALKRRRFWRLSAAVALVAASIFVFRSLIIPVLERSEIVTAMVEQGLVVATLTAGEGIPEEVQQYLFTPFYTTKNAASGKGLTMVRNILVNHGFTFSLSSEAGLTSFTIKLQ